MTLLWVFNWINFFFSAGGFLPLSRYDMFTWEVSTLAVSSLSFFFFSLRSSHTTALDWRVSISIFIFIGTIINPDIILLCLFSRNDTWLP